MVDRIRKVLRRLSPRERKQLTDTIRLILQNNLVGMDIKKLAARDDIYRVRKGDFRIIFCKITEGENRIIAIERRSDTTYNEF